MKVLFALALFAAVVVCNFNVPDSYDFREAHPEWAPAIGNQGICSSCWAFSSSYVYSARLFLATKKQKKVLFSPQYQVDCHKDRYLNGCGKGNSLTAFEYIQEFGHVPLGCKSYNSKRNPFGSQTKSSRCDVCDNNAKSVERYYSSGSYQYSENVGISRQQVAEAMKYEILTNGPVVSMFNVGTDFMIFFHKNKGGIYKKSPARVNLGSHAIAVVGWGKTDKGQQYWVCANSWGKKWNNDGYFKIVMYKGNGGLEKEGYTAPRFDDEDSYMTSTPVEKKSTKPRKEAGAPSKISLESTEAKLAAEFTFGHVKQTMTTLKSYTVQEVHAQVAEGINFSVLLNAVDSKNKKHTIFSSVNYKPDLTSRMIGFRLMAPAKTCSRSATETVFIGAAKCMIDVGAK
ncbi:hypothetical protein AKO1_012109 [Acrasis kona]|uniref:Peptidase C1A papain C-terminal domain-containing protein n=1 Tax=Acrasis kona TaxID=1008807 RepID=A0AAW2ZBD8_9EUKA